MEFVYISCKYGGNKERVELCEEVIKELVRIGNEKGVTNRVYMSPLHTFGYLYEDVSYEVGMDWCLELLRKCDRMYVIKDKYTDSRGVNMEIGFAKALNIPIEYISLEELIWM